MADVGPVAQAGVISTQTQAVQKPAPEETLAPTTRAEAPPPPPPPPVESGRGETVDTTV